MRSLTSDFLFMACLMHFFQKCMAAPNIVFVMLDDVGFGDTGFSNPDTQMRTPLIDKLVGTEGIKVNEHLIVFASFISLIF